MKKTAQTTFYKPNQAYAKKGRSNCITEIGCDIQALKFSTKICLIKVWSL